MKKFLLLFFAFALFGCSEKSASNNPIEHSDEKATLQLAMTYSESVHFDSLVILGTGSETIHKTLNAQEKSLELELFPGEWKFEASLYSNETITQKGSANIVIENGKTNYLTISMEALIGFIDISIPIGFMNPLEIQSGLLRITATDSVYTIPMEIQEPFTYFHSEALELNKTYLIEMELLDDSENIIFASSDSVYLSNENPNPHFTFNTLKGTLSLNIELDSIKNISGNATLPLKSSKRAPEVGEIIITEFLAEPSEGSDYEFVELFNGSMDSLILDNCFLGSSSKKGTTGLLDSGLVIAPMSYWTIGSDSAKTDAHPNKWTTLPSTKRAIVFTCESVLDSLYYMSSDSLKTDLYLPMEKGKSTQLKTESWKEKGNPSVWCTGENTLNKANSCEE